LVTPATSLQPGPGKVDLAELADHLAAALHDGEVLADETVHPRPVVRSRRRDEAAVPDEPNAVLRYLFSLGPRLRSITQARQDRRLPPTPAGLALTNDLVVPFGESLWVDFETGRPLLPPPAAVRLDILLL